MHSDTRPATPPRAAARLRRAALWAVRLALGAFFLMAGASKLVGAPDMIALFDEIGAGHWLRLLTGSVETAAAVMLLVPPVSALGAAALAGVMGLGAYFLYMAIPVVGAIRSIRDSQYVPRLFGACVVASCYAIFGLFDTSFSMELLLGFGPVCTALLLGFCVDQPRPVRT